MEIIKLKRGKPYLFTDVKRWGGKGDNLLKLNEVFNVPSGFIISSDTYTDWLKQTDLLTLTNEALKRDPEDAYQIIKESYHHADLPVDLVSRLRMEYDRIKSPLAIRSSSVDEDGSKNSFAGQHESILGVTDFNEVLIAIKEVYASLFTPRAITYRKNKQISTDDAIAIVVQQMINPTVSGVAFSPSPSNIEEILIESTYGLCTSVVEGRSCDIYHVKDTVTGQMVTDICPKKNEMEVYNPETRMIEIRNVPLSDRDTSSLTERQVLEVAKMVKSIERAYGVPMDMEYAYDQNNLLYVLQARPITGITKTSEELVLPDVATNKIIVRSRNTRNQGMYEGPVVVVRGIDHVNRKFDVDGDLVELNKQYHDGYILLTPEVPPQLEQYVTNAKAMYATECGTTGHAAAIAVEKGIIYLGRGNSNLPDLLQNIRTGMNLGIAVSNDEGIVYFADPK